MSLSSRGTTAPGRLHEKSVDPDARVAEHPHPRAVLAPLARMPGQLHGPEHALGVRHDRGDPSIRRRDRGDPARRAVRIDRIALANLTAAIYEPGGDEALAFERGELHRRQHDPALAGRVRDRQPRPGHAAE